MNLQDFIIIAKQKTYATGGSAADNLLADGSKVFVYQEDEYNYQDKYYGYNPFSGQEIVWHKNNLVWVMNYYGQVLSGEANPKEVYSFLRSALLEVRVVRPFRGPAEFVRGDWEYFDVSQGDLNNFSGQEDIYFKKRKVYQLNYLGGVISK